MTPTEQLLSFTGTLSFDGKSVVLNYNRLISYITDQNTPAKKRESFIKQLERIPEHVVTDLNMEPELLYFQRDGDRYLIRTRGPGRYNDHLLSLEGSERLLSAYSGTNPTGYYVSLVRGNGGNFTVENTLTDQHTIYILAGGRRHLYNYRLPGFSAAFTDEYEEDLELAAFQLTIIDRNVAP
ncbi:hypothetical protein PMI26_04031 [Pseudomonas sp. GM33]|jgi:hypothetical protein|uniref:hypothetical protein n=1 Tax=Pseudomonas TaxID=286 RepID=UPI0002700290|nr:MULTISPECIES: hypothetical protein [Pseudomonas]MDP9652503.1 hypothetical protein [Pseudomonas putida]EJM40304.1 hypothetical protein PMI26_04031 [Pseudomonas sp. GM33]MBV7551121.1 hypothetical protein [Pseudomonas sp. PDM28]PVZ61421.1 hypothetical protein C9422_03035 [Pseudomonas sp. B1(2018)]UVM04831.1 hypothetical protein LOY25_28200 [Pseudomonas laurylsulfatiphila]